MDNFLGILILVGIVVVYYLWNKATRAAGKKFNQTVLQPKSHKQGQLITKQKHVFAVKATPQQVKLAILNGVIASDTAPAVMPALHRSQNGDNTLIFDYGSKLQTVFRLAFSFSGDSEGTTGVYVFTNWQDIDGVTARQKEMKELINNVESALRRLDPALSLSSVTT